MTKAGNAHARRALIDGAWAYRSPAKVSRHLHVRLEKRPKPVQEIRWKAQVRLCQRDRRRIARELRALMWTIARAVAIPGNP
jgi:transposase